MIKFYDYLTNSLDRNLITDCIFFDFQKAFDTVPHHTLISRLHSTGIHGGILRWISDFLSNRFQKVRVDHITFDNLPVTSGVIQGSVLGPLLFNIFINEIDESLNHCAILKYADDTRIFLSSSKNYEDSLQLQIKVQEDMDNFTLWSGSSGMFLNVDKCFAVSFGRSDNNRTYTIDGLHVPSKTTFSDLGLLVQSPISFKSHVDNIVARSFKKLAVINKVFSTKSHFTIIELYKSFVRPLLEYSSVIWCPYTQNLVDEVERVQRRLCRMLPSLRHLSDKSQLKKIGLLSLRARRIRFQLITIYKMNKNVSGLNFYDFFELLTDCRTRGHSARIRTKYSSHNYRLHFFTVSSITMWNNLSQGDIDSPSITSFKSRLSLFFDRLGIW